tara:strand:+ start:326 stop:1666 length:1341 start_codon:yes stop_codon:yes gene_type:complete
MKKSKKKKYIKSKYNLGGRIKKYETAGMYAPNTVAAAGQGMGQTANIVYDEANPEIQAQREQALEAQLETASQKGEDMSTEMENLKNKQEQDLLQSQADIQSEFAAGESMAQTAAELAGETGFFDRMKTRRADRLEKKAGKLKDKLGDISRTDVAVGAAGTQAAESVTESLLPQGQVIDLPAGGMDWTQSFGAGADQASQFAVTQPPLYEASNVGITPTSPTPAGPDIKEAGALKQAITAGRAVRAANLAAKSQKFAELGKTAKAAKAAAKAAKVGAKVTKAGGTVAGQTGSAVGAGLKSFATSGAGIGLGASLLGSGISRLSDDDDATTMNVGETAGGMLSGAGTGMALGSVIPGIGNIAGGIIGGLYGLGKGLFQRGKARKQERQQQEERNKKVTEFNEEMTENVLSNIARAKAGELKQKTYSGYDLGRNITARKGGYKMPSYY